MENQIIIKTQGGLGNQLFQYALYVWLENNKKNVYLDTISNFSKKNKGPADAIHNGYELEKVFDIKARYATSSQIRKMAGSYDSFMYKAFCRITNYKKSSYISQQSLGEDKHFADILELDNAYLDGYWDTFYIADMMAPILKSKLFIEDDKYCGKNKKILSSIIEENAISVHIRHGDYLKLKNMYYIPDLNYYNRAIEFFKDNIENPVFYFFSDDIKWCKEKFHGLNCCFVDWNVNEDAYWDLLLMSRCKHNIIANSSFSTWASWLNSNPDKMVIRPDKYYIDATTNFDDNWPQNCYVCDGRDVTLL